jgi:hypothetical protein
LTPPTASQVDAALASLTGTVGESKPVTDLDRNLLRLRLVMEAKARNVSWTAIGAAMGVSGKACKAHMKHLARDTQRQLLLARRDGY